MTTRQLARLCRYWQRKLKLQDWQVSIRFASIDEMDHPDNVGECAVRLANRTADIKILKDGQNDYELEWAILHECCHILFPELLPRDRTKAQLFEAGIDQMSNTLLRFKRGEPPTNPV